MAHGRLINQGKEKKRRSQTPSTPFQKTKKEIKKSQKEINSGHCARRLGWSALTCTVRIKEICRSGTQQRPTILDGI
jgi:hypothetical protein